MAQTSSRFTPDGDPVVYARAVWAELGLVALLVFAVAVRFALGYEGSLFWDEYYHLLAARSWAADGSLTIGDGSYARAAWFSTMVGWLFRTFGESIPLAKVLMALVHTLWVAALFIWLRLAAGRLPAWAASLPLGLSPVLMHDSLNVRFYGISAVLILLAAASVYVALSRARTLKAVIPFVAVAVVCGLLVYEITPLARLWLAGLAVWAAGAIVMAAYASPHRVRALAGVSVLAAVALLLAWLSGWLESSWAAYARVPPWLDDDLVRYYHRYYERVLRNSYPTLVTGLPVAGILAFIGRPKMATLFAVAFAVDVVLLSGAGTRADRFALPIWPFFFGLWGLAIGTLFPVLRSWISSAVDVLGWREGRGGGWAGRGLMAVIVVFVILTNPGFSGLRHVIVGPRMEGVTPEVWDRHAPALRAAMDEVDVIVTANSLQTLYHVGDYDIANRRRVVLELSPPEEFAIDERTGKPAISTLQSLRAVMADHPTGLVFAERSRWENDREGFTREATEFVRANFEAVPLLGDTVVLAYRWGPSETRTP